jgi:hypothetical protein
MRYLGEGLKGKLRMYLEKISLDLEEENAIVMLSIMSERTSEIETVCLLQTGRKYLTKSTGPN